MALTIHVEFGFPRRGRGQPAVAAPAFKYAKQTDPEHHVPDVIERFNKYGFRGSKQVVQMIWAGAFERFPKLKIYVAEVQIGWVPNWMDQMDNEYGRQQYWAERVLGLPRLKRMPSEIAREHCYWGFNRNPVGVRIARQEMGIDKLMWASDFPHLESDWPNSRQVIEENFADIDGGRDLEDDRGQRGGLFSFGDKLAVEYSETQSSRRRIIIARRNEVRM